MTVHHRRNEPASPDPSTLPDPSPAQDTESWELEDLITLEEASRCLPDSPHTSTLYRWAERGRRGVRLRCVSVGHKRYTTRQWLKDFLVCLDAARRSDSTELGVGQSEQAEPSNRRRHRRRRDLPLEASRTRETLERYGLDAPASLGGQNQDANEHD